MLGISLQLWQPNFGGIIPRFLAAKNNVIGASLSEPHPVSTEAAPSVYMYVSNTPRV